MGEMAVYLHLVESGRFYEAQAFLERKRLPGNRDAVLWNTAQSGREVKK